MTDQERELSDVYVGVVAFAMGVLFLYWGTKGLYGFSRGLRTDTTDPAIGALGVIGGAWILAIAWRMFRGPGHRRHLLSGIELIAASVLTLIGAIWIFTFNPGYAVAVAVIGVMGLLRWAYLRRSDRLGGTATEHALGVAIRAGSPDGRQDMISANATQAQTVRQSHHMSLIARRFCLLSLIVAGPAAPVSAQISDSLHPGVRVRVIQGGAPRQLVGSVRATGETSFTLVPDGSSAAQEITLSSIQSLETAIGTRRPLARGTLWGALAGLAIGTTLALAEGQCLDCVDSDGGGPLTIGFTTAIGAVFGLAVGSVIEQDRWQPIQIPEH